MGKKKTYGVYGMVEYSMVIGVSGSYVRVDFRHGSMTVRGVEPCTFTTENEAVQHLIEHTKEFKQGRIKLVRSKEVPSTGAVLAKRVEASSPKSEDGSFSEVKNSQDAKRVLMGEPYRVPISELGNKEAILGVASNLGITFPNWK